MMDRLTTLDAEFLHVEDDTAPMHIAGICVFAGPAPGFHDLTAMVESRLGDIPRYRQRVENVPLEIGRPIWVDDSDFDITYHLRHTALPAPGTDDQLCTLMGRLMAHPLDRRRPLWEAWLVEGLEDDRWALIFKVHHCMVDGIAGVALLEALLDMEPMPRPVEPETWDPRPEPSPAAKVLGSWIGLGSDLVSWGSHVPALLAAPGHTLRTAGAVLGGAARLLARLTPTSGLSIEGGIGPHRSWNHASVSLDDIRTVRRAFGGTVNDVVLAAVTAGYRALLLAHDDDPDTAVVRAAIPVSVRHGQGGVGNRVSAMVLDLPVAVVDPVERLDLVRAEMDRLKRSHMTEAAEALTQLGDLAPPMLIGPISRMALRAEHAAAQRSVTTVVTNVPGPQFPLYCLGREMVEYRPFLGISYGVRVTTAILSYNGRVSIGVTGDADSVPDVQVLADAAAAAVAELVKRAKRRR
ncbi:MAG: wax ester/triacylglycerol synthase family O-acyltransferase [Acidimicrobiales bacterium]